MLLGVSCVGSTLTNFYKLPLIVWDTHNNNVWGSHTLYNNFLYNDVYKRAFYFGLILKLFLRNNFHKT